MFQYTQLTQSVLLPWVSLRNGRHSHLRGTSVVFYHLVWDFSYLQNESRTSCCSSPGEFRTLGCGTTLTYTGNEWSNSNRKNKDCRNWTRVLVLEGSYFIKMRYCPRSFPFCLNDSFLRLNPNGRKLGAMLRTLANSNQPSPYSLYC